MKFLVATILTALLAFIIGLFLPWWWGFALIAFVVALLIHQKAVKAFFSGFFGLLILWGGLAWWIDMKNGGLLAKKIATLLPLGGNHLLLVLVTGIVGGLVAGFAAMSGSYLRSSRN